MNDGGIQDSGADLDARTNDAQIARNLIFALRGEIVSLVNDIEGWVDGAILLFLGHEQPMRPFIQKSLLARMGLGVKVDIASEIAEHLGVKELLRPLFIDLKKANGIRVDQAHSSVGVDLETLTLDPEPWKHPVEWHSIRQSQRGRVVTPIDAENLQQDRDFVSKVGPRLFALMSAIAAPAGEAAEEVKACFRSDPVLYPEYGSNDEQRTSSDSTNQ